MKGKAFSENIKQRKDDRKRARTRAEGQKQTADRPPSQEGMFWDYEPLAHSIFI